MHTLQIKEILHQYIDIAQENQLQAIYALLEEKIESSESEMLIKQYNLDLKEAETRIDAGEYYTHEEIKRLIK